MLPLKRFGDFAEEESPLDGGKIKLDDLLNRELTVTGYKIRVSRFKEKGSGRCLTLQVEIDNAKHVAFTGSQVLIEQMEKYGHQLPFLVTIKKIDRYYTMT